MLRLMYITNDEKIARIADRTGVDRVWVDLEYYGKENRQKNIDTVKSNHQISDVAKIKKCLKFSKLMVRVNPINDGSEREIEQVVLGGADVIMLPYYKTNAEVKTFLNLVGGRAKTVLLLETKEAVEILDETLELSGIDEIHIGLNDLHLSYGLDFMFELMINGVVENLCEKIAKKGLPYGIGGIAKLGEGLVPAEYVIAEHYRLGSSGAILSRSFYDTVNANDFLAIESFFRSSLKEIRDLESSLTKKDKAFFENNRKEFFALVTAVAEKRRERNK